MSRKSDVDTELERLAQFVSVGYIIGLHIRYAAPLLQFSTYPQDWLDHYTENGYALRDPTIAWGFSTEGACRWSDISVPDTFKILDAAAGYGLKFGVSVSCGAVNSRSIAGFARADREFTDHEIGEVQRIMHRLHTLTEPPDHITDAQVEALRLVASGNRHAEAAAFLKISESAFKARLIAVRKKLLARTTAEAIQRAKDYRLI